MAVGTSGCTQTKPVAAPPLSLETSDPPPCVKQPSLLPAENADTNTIHNQELDTYDEWLQLMRSGGYRQAITRLTQLLHQQQAALGQTSARCATTWDRIADAAYAENDRNLAEEAARKVIDLKVLYLGVEGPDTAFAVEKLFHYLVAWHKEQAASGLVQQFADAADKHNPSSGARVEYLLLRAMALEAQGQSNQSAQLNLKAQGQFNQAVQMARRAYDVKRALPQELGVEPKIYAVQLVAARTAVEAQQYDAAYDLLADAQRQRYSRHQAEDPYFIYLLGLIAKHWESSGKTDKATQCLQTTLELVESSREWNKEQLAASLKDKIKSLRKAPATATQH